MDPRQVLRLPGIFLGIGLGGFVDGILLHQVLQWHHMLTSTDSDHIGLPFYPADTVHGLQVNTLWDGLFHVVAWVAVVVGLGVLYSRVRGARARVWSWRALWGWVLAGWGLFDLVEGLVDHQILGIHHVRSGPHQVWYDVGFLVFGAALLACGYLLQRSARAGEPASR
jgi:uncharacterized membrane protein